MEELNLNQICRTCKCETQGMWSIFAEFENANKSLRINEMLMACASIQVMEGDGLPSQICNTCIEQLKNAFQFKSQCEKVDADLKKYSRNMKLDEIKRELQNSDSVESLKDLQKGNNQERATSPLTPKFETDLDKILETDQVQSSCHKVFNTVPKRKRSKSGKLYNCNRCDKKFTRSAHLQRHEESHLRKTVHVCKICNKSLSRLEHFKRHMVTHLKNKPFCCETCNRVFSRAEHLQRHTPRCKRDIVYPCDICNRTFKRFDTLEVHRESHDSQSSQCIIENLDNIQEHYYQIEQEADNSDIDDFFEPVVEVIEGADDNEIKKVDMDADEEISTICETSIDSKCSSGMEKSEENLENEGNNSTSVKEQDISETTNNEDNANSAHEDSHDSSDSEYNPKKNVSPKKKRICRKPTRDHLRGRRKKEGEYGTLPCCICQEVFHTPTALDTHGKIKHKGEKIHKCEVCNKDFTRYHHLGRHKVTHLTVKPLKCHLCEKTFSRRDHLNEHLRMHNNSTDFQCDVCQKMFYRSDHLSKHKAAKHSGEKAISEKKYECPVCQKGFTTERYRDIHANGHSTTKEFCCQFCENKFPTKPQLTEHTRSHKKRMKRFLCSECGQGFVRNDYLVVHMRRHRGEKPFKCRFCEKGFPRTTDLTAHERSHTGEKNHLCTVCGKGFGRHYNLTKHMRTHSTKESHQCTHCEATFTQINDLKTHIRTHMKSRFQCKMCKERFLTGYLLAKHKRVIHGVKINSNLLRLERREEEPVEPPMIPPPFPKPFVADTVASNATYLNAIFANSLHAQLAMDPQFHMNQSGM